MIKPNKLLVLQMNDSCMPFIPHNPYIYFLSIFEVGLVNEKKNIMQAREFELRPLVVKVDNRFKFLRFF